MHSQLQPRLVGRQGGRDTMARRPHLTDEERLRARIRESTKIGVGVSVAILKSVSGEAIQEGGLLEDGQDASDITGRRVATRGEGQETYTTVVDHIQ